MDNDDRSLCLWTFSTKKKSRVFTAACVGLCGSIITTSANAALVSRLNGASVYDTDLGITWLADANLAASNTFGVSGISMLPSSAGQMNWGTAQNWIVAMNNANYLGYNDWRLPDTLNPDTSCSASNSLGYGCTGSAMGHLFYNELGGTANSTILNSLDPDLSKFQNIKAGGSYWSTDFTPSLPTTDAWAFQFGSGQQVGLAKTSTEYVWVVRTGDVLVPLPATFWLLASGLMGLIGLSRKNRINAK